MNIWRGWALVCVLGLIAGTIVFAYKLNQPPEYSLIEPSVNHSIPQSGRKKSEPISTPSAPITTLSAKKIVTDANILEPIQDLAAELEKYGLDAEEFQEKAEEGSDLSEYPESVLAAWRRVQDSIELMQKKTLEDDGVSEDYLKPISKQIPTALQDQAKSIDKFELDAEAEAFVRDRSRAQAIRDEDLEELVTVCRSNARCIEKAVKIWLDSNHLLTEQQIQFVERHM